jgi:hypothetical protein
MSEDQNKEEKDPQDQTDKTVPRENLRNHTEESSIENSGETNSGSKDNSLNTREKETQEQDKGEAKENKNAGSDELAPEESPEIKAYDDKSSIQVNEEREGDNQEKRAPEKSPARKKPAESNYQVSLINENLLRVKVNTERGINIEFKAGAEEARKITIPQSKDKKKKEIDLVISINPEYNAGAGGETSGELAAAETGETAGEKSSFFTPNPEVADLIKSTPEGSAEEKPDSEKTEDEILYEKLEKKNPYKLFRRSYQRHIMQALGGAVIIYLVAVALFSTYAAKQKTPQVEPDSQRIVIIQDMPEPKINLENVEDPNAPPPEEETETEDGVDIPRKIPRTTTPRIYRPRTENNTPPLSTNDTSAGRLDSLRNLADTNTTGNDTSTANNNNTNIPDSLRATYSQGDIGLYLDYPNSWQVKDSREVNANVKEFEGLYLTDTTGAKGAMTIFIFLDNGQKYDQAIFKTNFPVIDTTISAFRSDPAVIAGVTEYKFYIFGKTDKLIITASIKKELFESYKPTIENVIRSIRLKRPGTPG